MSSLFDMQNALNYDDVFILPQYSNISSRKEVDISVVVDNCKINVPIMPANMADIVNPKAALATFFGGGLPCLHRFSSIDESVSEFLEVKGYNPVFVSIGVNRDSQERFQALYNVGARRFVIDIAHGHSLQMRSMIEWIKTRYSDTYVMAGNIATAEAVEDLICWGADAVKVGIGPGANCLTKNVTGVTVPQFSAVKACAVRRNKCDWDYMYRTGRLRKTILVADGGIKEIGDVCKAIGAGADIVMAGKLFAGCDETPSFSSKKYSGSASKEIQTLYRTDKEYVPTPEGITTPIERKGPIKNVIEDIAGGLRSAYSYSGAKTTDQFHNYCKFGIRFNK
jgi:IMP dehydrogenase